MPSKRIHPLGIYEKALPNDFSFEQKFKAAKEAGFDFLEISVDESDSKLERLNWTKKERLDFVKLKQDLDFTVPTMCLSGHRKYPFGSHDAKTRQRAYDIMKKGIDPREFDFRHYTTGQTEKFLKTIKENPDLREEERLEMMHELMNQQKKCTRGIIRLIVMTRHSL